MIKRNITVWILCLYIILFVFIGYSFASNHDIEPAWSTAQDAKISKLGQTLKDHQAKRDRLLKKGDQLAERIRQEKQKSQGISSRKLDSLLRESQQLVLSLESLSMQIEETQMQLKKEYSTAITELVNQLEKESQEKKKKTLLTYLLKYIKAYEGLMEPVPLQIPKVNLEIKENDPPVEIRKKADFLSDHAALLKAKMLRIDSQVNKLEKEKALRDRVKKFADEINFFDNTLFVEQRRLPQREDDAQNVLTSIPGEGVRSEEAPPLSILQSEVPDSSPSDLIFSIGGIEKQIELLREQRLKLGEQVQELLQKMQIFYKKADDLGP